jgi:hypothetical protein
LAEQEQLVLPDLAQQEQTELLELPVFKVLQVLTELLVQQEHQGQEQLEQTELLVYKVPLAQPVLLGCKELQAILVYKVPLAQPVLLVYKVLLALLA